MQQPSKRSAVLIGTAVFAAVAVLSWYLGAPETGEPADVVEPAAPRALSQSPRMAPRDSQAPLFAVRSWAPPPPPPPPSPPVAPPEPPGPPPLPFVMIGMLLEDAGVPTYYLSQGERAYSVTDGEVVDGNYPRQGHRRLAARTHLPADERGPVPRGSSRHTRHGARAVRPSATARPSRTARGRATGCGVACPGEPIRGASQTDATGGHRRPRARCGGRGRRNAGSDRPVAHRAAEADRAGQRPAGSPGLAGAGAESAARRDHPEPVGPGAPGRARRWRAWVSP